MHSSWSPPSGGSSPSSSSAPPGASSCACWGSPSWSSTPTSASSASGASFLEEQPHTHANDGHTADNPINQPMHPSSAVHKPPNTHHHDPHSPASAKPPTGPVGASVQPGDLLLSNHTSPLEVLYLAGRFLPVFVAPAGVAPQVGGDDEFEVGWGWAGCCIGDRFRRLPLLTMPRTHAKTKPTTTQVSFERLSALGALWRATRVPPKQGKVRTLIHEPTLRSRRRSTHSHSHPPDPPTPFPSGQPLPRGPPRAGAGGGQAGRALPRGGAVQRGGRPRFPAGPVRERPG